MANFDLNSYETVEERLRRFWADPANADARIVTLNHTTPQDRAANTWVVEARIYLSTGDQAADLPKATGWAFEVDGVGMANKTSALENAETSAIGRCLANMNYSGNKRTSRNEMEKVERAVAPIGRNWIAEADTLTSVEDLRSLWAEARRLKAPANILKHIEEVSRGLSDKDSLGGGN